MNILLALLVGSGLILTVQSVKLGDPCTSHTDCNKGVDSIANTRCASGFCECTTTYYGEVGEDQCARATLGEACAGKTDALAFCLTATPDSSCIAGVCACNNDYTEEVCKRRGLTICRKISIGTKCNPKSGGDALCQKGIPNAKCSTRTKDCLCPKGMIYAPATGKCEQSYDDEADNACEICEETGGNCYALLSNATAPSGCVCEGARATSAATPADALTVGCDKALAEIGEFCEQDGSVECVRANSLCTHDRGLSKRFTCECKPGFIPVVLGNNKFQECVSSIATLTDHNCASCINNNGKCYDLDGDKVRDGCVCPHSRSTSDIYDPKTDCDTKHVSVECTKNKMTMCYIPHNTTAYPNMGPKLASMEYTVYVKNRLGQDPCIPEKMANSNKWCVGLPLDEERLSSCATKASYPKPNVITYQNYLAIKMKPKGRGPMDLTFHSFCQYDTSVHAFTQSGAEVVGLPYMASEGEEVHPTLTMNIYDEFKRDASTQGIRLGQPASLVIKMIENEDVYNSVKPEVCIASNRPELADPATSSILLLFDGCPVQDSYLNLRNTFYSDAANAEVSKTGLFLMFQFEDADFVFFHCAVKVCRELENCRPANCSDGRGKRSVNAMEDSQVMDDVHSRVKRAAPGGSSLEPLVGMIKVLPADETSVLLKDLDKDIRGMKTTPLVILGVIGGVMCLMLVGIVGLIVAINRRTRTKKFEVY